jgi:hypothetical protein
MTCTKINGNWHLSLKPRQADQERCMSMHRTNSGVPVSGPESEGVASIIKNHSQLMNISSSSSARRSERPDWLLFHPAGRLCALSS